MTAATTTAKHVRAKLEAVNADEAFMRLRVEGYVVLDNIVPVEVIERTRLAYEQEILGPATKREPNRGVNRWQAYIPFREPYCDPALWAHPLVLDIVERALGKDAVMQVVSSDTPLPGSDYQGVHTDIGQLFPELDIPVPFYALGLSVPLIDVTAENGPMELWPGTHLVRSEGVDIERAAAGRRSVSPLSQAGTVMLRDYRVWHRGTPNRSDRPRPRFGFAFVRPWFKLATPTSIPESILATLPERCRQLLRANPTTRG
jgi:ectoine hydroxylase-related dioxygenase (phytanoyl-CoA dioxygenase family)